MVKVAHAFQSAVSDGPDATLIRPSNWNDGHLGLEWYRTAADHTNSTTTPTNVTGLAFPIAAGELVNFVAYLNFFAAALTTGIRTRWTGPAAPTAVNLAQVTPSSASAAAMQGAAGFGVDLIGVGAWSTSLPGLVILHGHVTNGSNAGTVQLLVGSEVAGSLITLRRGALLLVYR